MAGRGGVGCRRGACGGQGVMRRGVGFSEGGGQAKRNIF